LAWIGIRRNLLRMLDCTTILQAGGDAGRSEGMARRTLFKSGGAGCSPLSSRRRRRVSPE